MAIYQYIESDEDDDEDDLIISIPYTRPDPATLFNFWTLDDSSTREAPALKPLDAATAIEGILSGVLVDRKSSLEYAVPIVTPRAFSALGPAFLQTLKNWVHQQTVTLATTKRLIYIERITNPEERVATIRHSFPSPLSGCYYRHGDGPGWYAQIYFASKFQAWPGVATLYMVSTAPVVIPPLPCNAIRFRFPLATGGKKDFDVSTDMPGAHNSLSLQCIRALEEQWTTMRGMPEDTRGVEFVLHRFIIPEIVFVASTAEDVLHRAQFVDFLFRGGDENETWAAEVKSHVDVVRLIVEDDLLS